MTMKAVRALDRTRKAERRRALPTAQLLFIAGWLGLIQQLGGIFFSLIAAAFGGGFATPLVMAAAALAFIASAAAIPAPSTGRVG